MDPFYMHGQGLVVSIEYEVFRPTGSSKRAATIRTDEQLGRYITELQEVFAQANREWMQQTKEWEESNASVS